MSRLRMFVSRLLSRFRRQHLDAELDDEIRFHLQMEVDSHLKRGLSPEEARREAHRSLGGVQMTREAYRDQRGLPSLETAVQDVRFGVRLLGRNRAFTAVAVATLALAIGANTAIFSVVHGVLLDPLPFEGADRIVTVWEDFSAQGGPEQEWIEVPNFFAWKAETDLFETMVAFGFTSANLTGRGEAQRLVQLGVSHDFFETFAVAPSLGRDFGPADDEPGAAPVAIISHGLWQREFAGDPGAIGQSLQLNGMAVTIVGVAPATFSLPGPPPPDLFAPLRLDRARAMRNNFFLQGLARLRPGVSVEQAETRLDAMMERIGREFPENRGVTISLVPLLDQLVAPVRTGLYVLLGVVGLVLLIACANVANLMLSRGSARARELAIRTAMGAGRGRLVRQLLTESLVLSAIGAVAGVGVAWWGTQALVASVPAATAPRLENIAIDGVVLAFTAVIAAAAGLVFGLAPVAQVWRRDAGATLKQGGRDAQEAGGGVRFRTVLAAGQIALALCLLIASGLTIRSFVKLMQTDPGFRPAGLTTAFVSMPPTAFAGGADLVAFMDGLVERLESRTGVESVAAVSVLPLAGSDSDTAMEIEGRPDLNGPETQPVVWYRRVTPSYFSTMGIPVLRGREFDDTDRAGAEPVVLVSDVTATRYWPGEDALGKRVRFGPGDWSTIVGITRGVRHQGMSTEPRPELYFAYAQRPGRAMTIVVRSERDEAALTSLLRSELREIAPSLPLSNVATMSSLMASSVAQPRFVMSLTAAFGLLALVLASVGIYGVMSYAVSRRTPEMGLRMALGAARASVLRLVVSQGAWVTAAGLAAGLVMAWWGTRAMSMLLFDVDARDPATFVAAPVLLALVSLVACLVPAVRATRIDPAVTLKAD